MTIYNKCFTMKEVINSIIIPYHHQDVIPNFAIRYYLKLNATLRKKKNN